MSEANQHIEAAKSFVVSGPKKLFIGGKWIAPKAGGTLGLVDPSTEQPLASMALADAGDVDLAVKAARKAFEDPSWSAIGPHQRTNYLLELADLLAANADELAAISSFEMGMPFVQAANVTGSMVDVLRYYAGWPSKMFGKTNPSGATAFSYTLREPLGIVAAIIPWNGPIVFTCWKMATALATGNTFILKPAEQAPLTCVRFAELIEKSSLPPGVFNLITGNGVTGAALVEHPDVNKITFTGSTAIGRQIMSTASKTLKKVSLELGGKSPLIILPDADLDRAVATALMGFTGNAGQACTAGSRVFIHESIYKEVSDKISRAAETIKVGTPFDPATQMGPIITKHQFDRVNEFIASGNSEGAKVSAGGGRVGSTGFFIQPTVFTGVTDKMMIAKEEIFGPVGSLLSFKDIDEAISRSNNSEYGLAASVWTNDLDSAQKLARNLKAGIVWINTLFEFDPVAPFGGYKQSGLGRELGAESIDDYTQIKTIVMRYGAGASTIGFDRLVPGA